MEILLRKAKISTVSIYFWFTYICEIFTIATWEIWFKSVNVLKVKPLPWGHLFWTKWIKEHVRKMKQLQANQICCPLEKWEMPFDSEKVS